MLSFPVEYSKPSTVFNDVQNGVSALQAAADKNKLDIVNMLLQANGDPKRQKEVRALQILFLNTHPLLTVPYGWPIERDGRPSHRR